MLSQSYFMLFGFPDPFMKILYKFFDTCSLCETVKLETRESNTICESAKLTNIWQDKA